MSSFDSVSKEWLVCFVEHRIGDPRIIRLIQKWLKAGVLEDGVVNVSDRGTGQGSVISPLLANVYLHYVFDLWAARWRRREATGDMIIVRYADDFIVGFQHESDARRFLDEMQMRLQGFALSLHPIMRELQRLELVLNMIKTLEAERDAIATAGKSSTHANAKKIQDLIRLKSVGPEIGTTLVGEVFYRQFNNRQQLGSYVGLTPSHLQSGSSSRDQGISKAGNPKARTIMIELAWLWLRHQPNSPLSMWFRERVGTGKGRIRRIAIVAVARKLLISLWRYLETGVVPTGAVLKG